MSVAVLPHPPVTTTTPTGTEYLSWSRIRSFRDCPKLFYYRYIAKVPAERVPAALPFGGVFHQAIELVTEARLAGRGLPSLETLLAEYDRAWAESTSNGPPVAFAKGEDAKSLRETASRMLEAYREFSQSEKSEIIAIEHEARFAVAGVPIVARLDSVERRGEDLLVTDVKTSKSRYGETKILESVGQTVLYSHAAVELLRALGARRIVPRFVVVTKGKSPVVQVIEPPVGREDAQRVRELVADAHQAISAGAFPRNESWRCARCPFADKCLGKK
ncbi:MAG: PD-(D/E)XK nuclease family protein [Planctomycetota bacterium]|nr:PD-(D/E)XK nuclease family protein [Planctomycetota bacterium]